MVGRDKAAEADLLLRGGHRPVHRGPERGALEGSSGRPHVRLHHWNTIPEPQEMRQVSLWAFVRRIFFTNFRHHYEIFVMFPIPYMH